MWGRRDLHLPSAKLPHDVLECRISISMPWWNGGSSNTAAWNTYFSSEWRFSPTHQNLTNLQGHKGSRQTDSRDRKEKWWILWNNTVVVWSHNITYNEARVELMPQCLHLAHLTEGQSQICCSGCTCQGLLLKLTSHTLRKIFLMVRPKPSKTATYIAAVYPRSPSPPSDNVAAWVPRFSGRPHVRLWHSSGPPQLFWQGSRCNCNFPCHPKPIWTYGLHP